MAASPLQNTLSIDHSRAAPTQTVPLLEPFPTARGIFETLHHRLIEMQPTLNTPFPPQLPDFPCVVAIATAVSLKESLQGTAHDVILEPVSTPAGNAPVTKVIWAASVSSSVLLQAAHAARRPVPAYVAAFEHIFVFRHPGELLVGAGLLYYSRLFERQVTALSFQGLEGMSLGILIPVLAPRALITGEYGSESLFSEESSHHSFRI